MAGPSSVSELRAPWLGLSRVAGTLDVLRLEAPRDQRRVPAARSLAGPRRSCGVKSLVRIPVRTIDDIDGARCRTAAPINRTPASPLRTTARARSRSPGTSAPSLAAPRFAFAPSPSPRGRCPPFSASCLPAAASASVSPAPPAPRPACHRRRGRGATVQAFRLAAKTQHGVAESVESFQLRRRLELTSQGPLA